MRPSWSSYDPIAQVYAAVAERLYFTAPARDLAMFLDVPADAKVLDIGAGSGAVTAELRGFVVACDPAMTMLEIVRRRVPRAHVAAGALPLLPFRANTFDAVTLAFVLSHVANVQEALSEVRRILIPGGKIGLSSWSLSAGGSPPGSAWERVAHRFVPAEELREQNVRSVPSEDALSRADGVVNVLEAGGFVDVRVERRSYRVETTIDEFIQSRQVSMGARYMATKLASEEWARFVAMARDALRAEFGDTVTFATSVNLVVARSAR